MTELYLAYGSNMLSRRIEERLGRCRVHGTVSVGGFSLRFHKRGRDSSGKCDAFFTGDPSDVLHGVVYELSERQRATLDGFEGTGYESRDLSIDAASGVLEIYTYVARAQYIEPALRPFPWYKSIVVAGALANGLPVDYLEYLRGIETVPDDDARRMALHLALLEGGAD